MKKFTLLGALWFSLMGFSQESQPSTEQSLRFEENKGQIVDTDGNLRNDILFTAETGGVKAYLRNSGISYVFADVEHIEVPEASDIKATEAYYAEIAKGQAVTYHRVDLQFVGANLNAEIETNEVYESTENFYLNSSEGINNVHSYEVVTYKEIYSNIDLQFHTKNGQLKYDFIVHPGGNPSDIQIDMEGMDKASLDAEGQLVLNTSLGTITEEAPYTFQSKGRVINSSFSLADNVLSFNVADFNRTEDLVIDPTLLWSTYYGGTQNEEGAQKIETDALGNLYVACRTYSTDFPVTVGAFSTSNSGNADLSLSKFDKDGNQLWATYYGGNNYEEAWGLDVDINDDVIISGHTYSSTFPITVGAYDVTYSGGQEDFFVSKFNNTGGLIWSTYLGGTGYERNPDVASDAAGDIIIVGSHYNDNYPTTTGAFDETFNGSWDMVASKLSGDGTTLMWSTYLGGTNNEDGRPAVTINSANEILIIGCTYSSDFPTTVGAYDESHNGQTDWVLMNMSSAGAMNWSTFIGGYQDEGYQRDPEVVVDEFDNIYIAGTTNSPNMPISIDAFQDEIAGNFGDYDVFLGKFDASGTTLMWSTYLGGYSTDMFGDLDYANGWLYAVGGTYTSDFPITTDAYQEYSGDWDNFTTQWSTDGDLVYSSYFGGVEYERPEWVTCAYGLGQLNVATQAYSNSTPTTTGAFSESNSGNWDQVIYAFRFCDINISLDSKTDVLCNNELTGEINTSFTSYFENPVTLLWNNGETTEDITNLPAGDYDLVATGGSTGCTVNFKTVTIEQPDTISTDMSTSVNPLCFENTTGSIDLTVEGGVADYTYLWTDGETTQDLSNLAAGTYNATITDANGCVFNHEHVITEPDDITATFVVTNIDCNGNSNGTIDMTVLGGVPGYSYEWSNAETTQNLSGLAAGSYSVLINDANGCSALKAQTVTQPEILELDLMATDIDCNGNANGEIDATVTGGVANYSYVWSNAEITEDVSALIADMYTLTATDDNGCVVIDSVEIMEAEAIVITGTTTLETFGSDGNIYTYVAGGEAPYSYSWDNGTAFPDAFSLSSGDYTVTVTDANGCDSDATFTIESQLGIESSMVEGLSVYPNPFTNAFSINYSGTYTWTIFDASGKLIQNGTSTGTEQINLNEVNGGVYILKVETTEGINAIRLIKE